MLPTIGRDLGLVTTGAALAVATLALRRAYASRTAANSARSPPPVRTLRIAASKLERFVAAVFTACGSFEKDAATAAEVLVLADLRGIDSHGVARLASYFRLLQSGEINPRPNVRIVRETASTATLDGDRGLGLIVGPKANALAMKKAAAVGSGWVAVRNTFHYGIAGYYSLAALEQDMIGLSMTNTSCCVAPLWGRERLLGTNPIAIAFPAASERPLVIDLATSTVPLGKVEEFARRAEALLPGWAIGPAGEPTTTPEKVIEGGALLPLGGDFGHGGHKG
jgi:LDH2 family malate/lactate/ureidoglycolate dehydrogenase